MKKKTVFLVCACVLFYTGVVAGDDDDIDFSRPHFLLGHEFGAIVKGLSGNTEVLDGQGIHRSIAWVDFSATRNERLTVFTRIGGVFWFPTHQQSDKKTKVRFFSGQVNQLNVQYAWGDPDSPLLKLTGGVFRYKYNPSAVNLGEYMFRSGTYPGWLATGALHYIGTNSAQLTGLKLTHSIGESFRHDFIMNLESEIIPTNDIHFTYIANYDPVPGLSLGGGIQLTRFLPARPSNTTPDVPNNRYLEYGGKYYLDRQLWYDVRSQYFANNDSLFGEYLKVEKDVEQGIADPNGQQWKDLQAAFPANHPYFEPAKDWAFADSVIRDPQSKAEWKPYTQKGIKPMVYFNLDIGTLIGADIFKANQFSVFAEAAILGIKKQPVLYENISERIPLMAGINIPTFGLLDMLSFQIEHYKSKFPNSIGELQNADIPQPDIRIGKNRGYHPDDWDKDDIKWSVYLRREVWNGLFLIAQFANDHGRGWEYPTGKTDWEMFPEKKHWYWMGQLLFKL